MPFFPRVYRTLPLYVAETCSEEAVYQALPAEQNCSLSNGILTTGLRLLIRSNGGCLK